MSRLVRHSLTTEPVLVSPERGERPGAWGQPAADAAPVEAPCPFCPGNEEETPPELSRHDAGGRWTSRVVPNKYPAISPSNGVASHEVLIDSPDHVSPLEDRDLQSLSSTIAVWKERWAAHAAREGVASVILFRNEGRAAGQSIPHPHSQLIALPFVPPRLESELRTFSSAASCPLCGPRPERDGAKLVVASHRGVALRSPSAPRLPYECWIVPDRHEPDWLECDSEGLAAMLQASTRALRRRWPGAAFNLALSSAPPRDSARQAFHWHMELLPRLTNVAGFELATGSWMNIVDGERAASELREALAGKSP